MYIMKDNGGNTFLTSDEPLDYYKTQLQEGTMTCLRINSCASIDALSFNAGVPTWTPLQVLNHG